MLIDKEYPATHSAATAWFMIDDDGNVAVMDAPCESAQPSYVDETSVGSLLFGVSRDSGDEGGFRLTKGQMKGLLNDPAEPTVDLLENECVVMVEEKKVAAFAKACDEKVADCRCIDPQENLYFLSLHCERTKQGKIIQKILGKKMLKQVYPIREFVGVDEYEEEGACLASFPYFIYTQDNGMELPQRRMNVPSDPVNEGQLSKWYSERAYRIPGRFAEMPYVQIAALRYCRAYEFCDAVCLDGFIYELRQLDETEWGYCAVNEDSCDFLPKPYESMVFTTQPRLLILSGVERRDIFVCEANRPIFMDALWIPFRDGDDWSVVERICLKFKPYAILCLEGSLNDGAPAEIRVGDLSVPLCDGRDLDRWRDELSSLSRRAYRGEVIRQMVPKAEMEGLLEKGVAQRF